MKGCKVCLDSLWKDGKPCPNRQHYFRPKGKTVSDDDCTCDIDSWCKVHGGKKSYRERQHMGNRKSRPGAPDLRKKKDKGSWSKIE